MNREEYLSRAVELAPRGRDLPQSKLHPYHVRIIRERNGYGVPRWVLAKEYGVHIRTIDKVCTYETWINVSPAIHV